MAGTQYLGFVREGPHGVELRLFHSDPSVCGG